MNTYVYSVISVTAQEYNPVYTRVCIHTMFSCQVCFKENRRFAFYQDNSSAWRLMVHGFIDSVVMSESGNVDHLVRAVFGVDKWSENVPSMGQMTDMPIRWPECLSDHKFCQHLQATKNSTGPKLSSSTRHKPIGYHPFPSSTGLDWRCSETSHGPLSLRGAQKE